MAAMTKRVNINAPIAIRNITPPIYGVCKNVIMSTGDILKCLCKRAIVDEILPDGSTVRLNMRNYYTDNGAGLDASVIDAAKEEFVGQSAAQDEEPAAAIVVNTDQTNVSGVVNEIEDIDLPNKEDNSKDTTADKSIVVEETTPDTDVQTEQVTDETFTSSDNTNEESTIIATEEVSTTIDTDVDEEIVKEDDNSAKETVKEEKTEVADKKSTTESASNTTKKKSSNNSSKKKTTSNK